MQKGYVNLFVMQIERNHAPEYFPSDPAGVSHTCSFQRFNVNPTHMNNPTHYQSFGFLRMRKLRLRFRLLKQSFPKWKLLPLL